MEFKYKFILKKIVCNKLRKIYIRVNSKSRKQYLKYKGEMINIKEYKSNFKNINKKKYKKIKGGEGEVTNVFKDFIYEINQIEYYEPDALTKFKDAYDNCVNNWSQEDGQEDGQEIKNKLNLKFLTELLKYLESIFNNLSSDSTLIKLLEKLSILLFVLDQEAITGVHTYSKESPDPKYTPYVHNEDTYFNDIVNVINKFRDTHEKIIWNIFEKSKGSIKNKKEIKIEDISICNTDVKILITIMISKKGLNNYNPNHKSCLYRPESTRPESTRPDSTRQLKRKRTTYK